MSINSELKEARQNTGLSQMEVAEKASITERSYQRYEAGERVPNVYTAQLIAKVLNAAVEIIFPLPECNPDANPDKQAQENSNTEKEKAQD